MIEGVTLSDGVVPGIGGTTLIAGALIGIGHSFEPDHVAAITTLVDKAPSKSYPTAIGALWGIGHSVTITVISLLLVLAGIRLPEQITALFGLLAGVVLVYLGMRMFIYVSRNIDLPHGVDDGSESRSHGYIGTRLIEARGRIGDSQHHDSREPLVVGIIHGFAGSGLIVIALVSTAQTLETTLAFLVGYSILSIMTMGGVSFLWGCALNFGIITYFRGLAGVVSFGVGIVLIAEFLISVGFVPV
jgi:hypothetical protein